MHRVLRTGVLAALVSFSLLPARAHADPLLMFLLGVARDMVITHATRPASRPQPQGPMIDFTKAYPGTLVEPAHLRKLIDECFGYLGDGQRREIFESLDETLSNPKHAAVRAPMIEYFTERALAVRATRARLAQMSPREKQMLVAEFRVETAGMPQEEQEQLAMVLRKGLLPLPEDLNQSLLAALEQN